MSSATKLAKSAPGANRKEYALSGDRSDAYTQTPLPGSLHDMLLQSFLAPGPGTVSPLTLLGTGSPELDSLSDPAAPGNAPAQASLPLGAMVPMAQQAPAMAPSAPPLPYPAPSPVQASAPPQIAPAAPQPSPSMPPPQASAPPQSDPQQPVTPTLAPVPTPTPRAIPQMQSADPDTVRLALIASAIRSVFGGDGTGGNMAATALLQGDQARRQQDYQNATNAYQMQAGQDAAARQAAVDNQNTAIRQAQIDAENARTSAAGDKVSQTAQAALDRTLRDNFNAQIPEGQEQSSQLAALRTVVQTHTQDDGTLDDVGKYAQNKINNATVGGVFLGYQNGQAIQKKIVADNNAANNQAKNDIAQQVADARRETADAGAALSKARTGKVQADIDQATLNWQLAVQKQDALEKYQSGKLQIDQQNADTAQAAEQSAAGLKSAQAARLKAQTQAIVSGAGGNPTRAAQTFSSNVQKTQKAIEALDAKQSHLNAALSSVDPRYSIPKDQYDFQSRAISGQKAILLPELDYWQGQMNTFLKKAGVAPPPPPGQAPGPGQYGYVPPLPVTAVPKGALPGMNPALPGGPSFYGSRPAQAQGGYTAVKKTPRGTYRITISP